MPRASRNRTTARRARTTTAGAIVLPVSARYYADYPWILAIATNLRGVFTQGKTLDEARANLIDALYVMASDRAGLSGVLSKPSTRPPRGVTLVRAERLIVALPRPR